MYIARHIEIDPSLGGEVKNEVYQDGIVATDPEVWLKQHAHEVMGSMTYDISKNDDGKPEATRYCRRSGVVKILRIEEQSDRTPRDASEDGTDEG
jgi:hypothetical protein